MPKYQVDLLTLSCIPVIHYFKALQACLAVVQSTHLIKLNPLTTLMDVYPYAKKGLHTLSI